MNGEVKVNKSALEHHARDEELSNRIRAAAQQLRSWADELDEVASNDYYSDVNAILQLASCAEHAGEGIRDTLLYYLLEVKHHGLKVD